MTWWQWLLAWFGTSFVCGPLLGKWLKQEEAGDGR